MNVSGDNRCIYCLRNSTEAPPEHVIPEVLGCPEGAVLTSGEVCQACNSGLAHIDQALADSFDFARLLTGQRTRLLTGQRTKKGKGPSVTGRSNLFATVKDGEPAIYLNFGPGDVTLPEGRVLKAPNRSSKTVRARMRVDGRNVEVNVQADMFHNPKFSRAVHKVAVGVIALALGRSVALSPSLDRAREFVVRNKAPKRLTLCRIPPEWRYFNRIWSPYTSEHGYCVVVTLCGIQLTVDCTPDQTSVPKMLPLIPIHDPKARWVTVN